MQVSAKWINYDAVDYSEPEFQLYGRRFGASPRLYMKSASRRMAANMAVGGPDVVEEAEVAADDMASVKEHKMNVTGAARR